MIHDRKVVASVAEIDPSTARPGRPFTGHDGLQRCTCIPRKEDVFTRRYENGRLPTDAPRLRAGA